MGHRGRPVLGMDCVLTGAEWVNRIVRRHMSRRSVVDAPTVILDVKPGAKPQIDCDLIPEELQAVGLITVQWAHLEHCLFVRTCEIAEELGGELPDDCLSLSFTRRLQAFRKLVVRLDFEGRKKWERVADRIANAEGKRHKITHGLWVWDNSRDGDLVALSSFRPPNEFDAHVDVLQLTKLGSEIGELLFELSFPGGLMESLLAARPIPPRSKKYKSALNDVPRKRKGK